MSDTMVVSALGEILESLSQCLDRESAQRLMEFRVSARVQQRVDYLGEQANEGLLTNEERSEYEALIHADEFIGILLLKAKRRFDLK
jgi:hypothetical protein